MFGMMQGNLLNSITISNGFLGGYALIHLCYFGILSFGIFLVLIDIVTRRNPEIWGVENRGESIKSMKIERVKRIFKKIIIKITWIGFIFGGFCAFITLFGVFEFVTTQIAYISSQYGIFLSFIFLSNMIILC
jgi:hypothetical protein